MMLRSLARFFLIQLFVLALFLSLSNAVRSAYAQLVSPAVIEKAQKEGQVSVIVRLASSEAPGAWMESDILQSLRRADIARMQAVVRSSLFNIPHQVRRQFDDFPFIALQLGPAGLQTLESLRGVVTEVVEDELHRPFLAESVPLVQADQVWPGGSAGLSLDGSGTVVAILDTGVDKNHPFLNGKVVEEACFSSNDQSSPPTFSSVCPGGVESSFLVGSGLPCDVDGCDHGTHVAGIAAGNGQDGAVAPFSGVAKGASIMAVQVFTMISDSSICALFGLTSPCALAFTSDIMAGLQRVFNRRAAHNFAAVNMSLGGGQFTSNCDTDPLKPIIDSLRAANIATVIASGNNGFTNALSSPGCISSAVSVGSTGDGSLGATADEVSSFSNSASFLSLLAPGQWIESSIPGGGFATFAGTSMATPHVAGAFAILKQATATATVSQMLDALQNGGLSVTDGRNSITKSRIQIFNALDESPTLQFDSATYAVDESGGTATITVTRTGATTDVSTVQYAASDGTAAAPADYTAKSGTLTFSAGETTKTFTIPIVNDTLDEPDETVNLTLSNPTGGTLGSPGTAVLTIIDNDTAGTVQFGFDNYSVTEAGRTAKITVSRVGGTASGVTVDYATSDDTATAGSHYAATSGTLTFGFGQTSRTFTIPITNGTLNDGNKTVNLILSNPTGGATLGSPSTAVLTITDNDLGGALRFSAANYKVSEGRAEAVITVRRSGGAASGVTVEYATSDGTATAGSDYIATAGTLTFDAGQASRRFTIPIFNDTIDEPNETINLTLSNPTGGATLGSPSAAVLTIVDNDLAGSLQFSAATYSANETEGTATITVTRSRGTASGVTVDYSTSDGTATADSDYTATSGTLNFDAGQTSQTFAVPILDNALDEPNKTVILTLSNPSGGATLGKRSTAVLTIVDND